MSGKSLTFNPDTSGVSVLRAVVRQQLYQLKESWASDFQAVREVMADIRQRAEATYGADHAFFAMGFAKLLMQSRKFARLGWGGHRAVFGVPGNPDIVLKVASQDRRSFQMNLDDLRVGRDPRLAWMFPRVYDAAPDGLWILQEAVLVANQHEAEFCAAVNKMFNLSGTDPLQHTPLALQNLHDWDDLTSMMLLSLHPAEFTEEAQLLPRQARQFNAAANLANTGVSFETVVQQRLKHLQRNQAWRRWISVMRELKIEPGELHEENVGLTTDDARVIILDASFEDSFK